MNEPLVQEIRNKMAELGLSGNTLHITAAPTNEGIRFHAYIDGYISKGAVAYRPLTIEGALMQLDTRLQTHIDINRERLV